jgi:hypothetical protein
MSEDDLSGLDLDVTWGPKSSCSFEEKSRNPKGLPGEGN